MAPKAKKRLMAGKAGKPAKKMKRSPLALHGAFGYLAEDVASVLDLCQLTAAFDELTVPRLWSMGMTHAALSKKLPLRVLADAPGCCRTEMHSVLGVPAPASDGGDQAAPTEPHFVASTRVSLRAAEGKGRGWFADAALAAGTVVLVERPLVGILDGEWRDKPWADNDSADTTALGMELAKALSPSVRGLISALHPVSGAPLPELDKDQPSESEDDQEAIEAAAALKEVSHRAWAAVEEVPQEEKDRLQAVVRLNSLGFYTSSELLCHSGLFSAITGSGLFALASGFNHSCDMNVSRLSIGDLTVFVTNRPVKPGQELCISYVESELLSAPRSLRSQSLNRDFTCACPRCAAEEGAGETGATSGRRFLTVDATVQAELSVLPPDQRVEAVAAALRGEDFGGEEEAEEEGAPAGPPVVLGKDAQELRVVQAMAYMQAGKHSEALAVWRRLAAFACRHCPPYDEALAVYATQAALCSFAAGDPEAARGYVTAALQAHRVSSGCEDAMYLWRYKKEVEMAEVSEEAKKDFWALVDAAKVESRKAPAWKKYVEAWKFKDDEVPEAFSGGSAAPPAA